MIPTTNLIEFSGMRASGPADGDAHPRDEDERGRRPGSRKRNVPLIASEGDHDERDLEPFEQDAFESEREAVPVEASAR